MDNNVVWHNKHFNVVGKDDCYIVLDKTTDEIVGLFEEFFIARSHAEELTNMRIEAAEKALLGAD